MAATSDAPIHRPEVQPRTGPFTALGVGLGLLSHGMFNRLRKRPVSYQPWYFVINAAVGGMLLCYTAKVYDDITDTMEKRYSGYSRLPAWMLDQLSPEQLASENRRETVKTFYQKFDSLAKLEAAEYEERLKASRAAREEASRGAPAPLQ